jgi:hypothetical protein
VHEGRRYIDKFQTELSKVKFRFLLQIRNTLLAGRRVLRFGRRNSFCRRLLCRLGALVRRFYSRPLLLAPGALFALRCSVPPPPPPLPQPESEPMFLLCRQLPRCVTL